MNKRQIFITNQNAKMKHTLYSLLGFGLVAAIILFSATCSTSSIEDMANAQNVSERIDLKLTGEVEMDINEQSLQGDVSRDLINYVISSPAEEINFTVELSSEYNLAIRMYNRDLISLSQQIGLGYEIYDTHVTQELDDKSKYVIISLQDDKDGEISNYTSMVIGNHGVQVNAFTVDEYDFFTKEMLCRLNNVTLRNQNNSQETINIIGTFRAAITE